MLRNKPERQVKIVKFVDGTYGIRRGFFRHRYRDLRGAWNHWWRLDSEYAHNCRNKDLDLVISRYNELTDKGTPV